MYTEDKQVYFDLYNPSGDYNTWSHYDCVSSGCFPKLIWNQLLAAQMASNYTCCFLVLLKRNMFDPPLFYNHSLIMVFLFGNVLTSASEMLSQLNPAVRQAAATCGSDTSCLLTSRTWDVWLFYISAFQLRSHLHQTLLAASAAASCVCSLPFSSFLQQNILIFVKCHWNCEQTDISGPTTNPGLLLGQLLLFSSHCCEALTFCLELLSYWRINHLPSCSSFADCSRRSFFPPPAFLLWFWFPHRLTLWGLLCSDVSSEKPSQHRVLESGCAVFRLQLRAQ